MNAGAAQYAQSDTTYFLRLSGEVRYPMGCSLDEFLDRLFQRRDCDNIVVDLTAAEFIDSTNLGLLAKIANFTRQHLGKKTTLISSNDDINEVLEKVSFSEIFIIHDGPPPVVDKWYDVPITEPCRNELAKTLIESHNALCKISDENQEDFRSFVDTIQRQAAAHKN